MPRLRAASARPTFGALAVALALASTFGVVGSGSVVHDQADQPLARGMELVGRSDLGGRGLNAAVWSYRNFAYVGTTSQRPGANASACPGWGVTIVDIANPSRPSVVGSIAQRAGTSAEDVQVLAVDSSAFRGDLMAAGLQRCGADGSAGLSLWDVTDPRQPSELGFFDLGRGPVGVHEFWLFRRQSQTIALLAVPFSETLDPENQGDVRIVDLSNPRAPVQLGHWGAVRALGLNQRGGQGRNRQTYAHSVRASPDGRFAYVAYWDGGVIILDISDLANPRYAGRTGYGPDEEGNAHSTALAKGGRVLIEADEDLDVRSDALAFEGEGNLGTVEAAYGAFKAALPASEAIVGEVSYVGRGCPASGQGEADDPYLADPLGRVALVDRGDCTSVDKVVRAQRLGAIGVLIANGEPGLPNPDGDTRDVGIPAAMIRRESAEALKDALARGGVVTVRFSAEQVRYDDWGYLRFWDIADPANPVQMATFATEHARTDKAKGPPDEGWYSAHQVVVLGERLYASWYADGIRVVDIADPTQPREVGFFVPPRSESGTGPGAPPPFVWGVYVRGDLILASEERTGLYILREVSGSAGP